MNWEDCGRLLPLGGLKTDGTVSEEEAVWDVGLTPTGGGDG